MAEVDVFSSWSGGKDSALALHEAALSGARPRLLVTMMMASGERSRSHGLSRELLSAQADCLGVPIRFGSASWEDYEAEMVRLVAETAAEFGLDAGVFGDIDIEGHRAWVESVCAQAGERLGDENAPARELRALLPLWRRDRSRVLTDLLGAGFEAVIIAVRDGVLSPDLLGLRLDAELVDELIRAGVDPAGEFGEYHTIVTDGPLFKRRLSLEMGERVLRDGVWFRDACPA